MPGAQCPGRTALPVCPLINPDQSGADDRDRTGDLVLTKDALCLLSYIGPVWRGAGVPAIQQMERETGIEPATNSLEGCDSTTELLPPSVTASLTASAGQPARQIAAPSNSSLELRLRSGPERPPTLFRTRHRGWPASRDGDARERFAKAGGEGRIRTSEAAGATDLQSAAFDRFATSPLKPVPAGHPAAQPIRRTLPAIRLERLRFRRGAVEWNEAHNLELAKGFEPPTR